MYVDISKRTTAAVMPRQKWPILGLDLEVPKTRNKRVCNQISFFYSKNGIEKLLIFEKWQDFFKSRKSGHFAKAMVRHMVKNGIFLGWI